ncbi:hypothetical protein BDW22DRAFT_1402168 [Trametopsis cervina]|nr:hypothetical protein BDW22DRAFT_1402168 [Trametopsis cervina]
MQYLRGHMEYLAKILELVSVALRELRQYYATLKPRSEADEDLKRFLPNPTRRGPEPRLAGLEFRRRISCRVGQEPEVYIPAMWEGLYEGKRVLIKFTERYSVRAHRILAECEAPKAPKLYFAERLLGGVWMVVMEYLEGQDADRKFGDKALPDSVVRDIEEALKLLHGENLVFGDLRRPNIMVNLEHGKYHAKLVDFDFSGRENDIDGENDRVQQIDALDEEGGWSYDCFLRTDLNFPQGMQPCKPMRKQHDREMLKLISCSQPPVSLKQHMDGVDFRSNSNIVNN